MLAAPLAVVAVMALTVSVAAFVWVAFRDAGASPSEVATIVVPALVGVAAFLAIRGCFVEVSERGAAPDGMVVRDVVAWVTVRRVPQDSILTARVRRGPWRLYVLETDRDEVVKLIGASPLQFPSTLLSDARDHDLADLDLLLGSTDEVC